jgi:hypothetical protein
MDAATQRATVHDLNQKLIRYWHDVDFNWGRNAGAYYCEHAVFEGPGFSYDGRAEIEQFYAYRRDRGPRVVLHAVTNFNGTLESDARATAAWVCLLYAHDGEAPQPSAPPINISLVRDVYVREREEWLVERRSWSTLFEGGAPVTKLARDELERRRHAEAQPGGAS